MNMGLLAMLEGPSSEESIEHLITSLTAGALRVERHHERLWYSPIRHDYPYWLHDGSLDVDMHVHHHQLDTPGDEGQLHALVEKLLMRPLDRSQPLWEFHLIDGLQDNRHALIFKLHHACADGLTALRMFAATVAEPDNMFIPWPPTERVTTASKMRLAAKRAVKNPLRLLYNLLAVPVLRLYLLTVTSRQSRPRPPQATRFIGPIGARRNYLTIDFPLSGFRRINRKYGSSENEVLMSIYSGALRRYLLDRNELPERSLHAGMPISMMFSQQRQQASNQAGLIRVTLGTRIEDPVQRLEAMKLRCARALERKPSRLWQRMEVLWLNASPQLIAVAAKVYRKLLEVGRICPTTSAITTYMPGPPRPVAVGDYSIEAIYPLSIIYHGCGLSISAMRYGGNVHVGVAADQQMLPDPERFKEYLRLEFDALYASASELG